MATTFATFVAGIQSEINDIDAAMKTRIEGWTNDRHHYICGKRRWGFLIQTSSSTNIKSSNHPYLMTALNPDPRAVLDVRDEGFSPPRPLYPTTADAVRTSLVQYTSNTNAPNWFYVENGYLNLFPVPDTTGRNYTIRYCQEASTYSTGSTDSLLIPDRWIEVLKDAVLSKAYNWLDKEAKSQKHEAMFQKGLQEMTQQDTENNQIIYGRQFYPPDIFPDQVIVP